jgi:hypothetical protein
MHRDEAQEYLMEAQDELEEELAYPVVPKWIIDRQTKSQNPFVTKKGNVIAGGVMKDTMISAGASVFDATADPYVVTIATTLTDTSYIHIFYPGTDQEIYPTSIVLLAGNMVITIPRCRMVLYSMLDNPIEGWDYADDSNFQQTVDIREITNDVSTGAYIYYAKDCTQVCEFSYVTACENVVDNYKGIIKLTPASYSSGWTVSSCIPGKIQYVDLHYYAGLTAVTRKIRTIIIRLAHSKMPNEICGCDVFKSLWARDRNIPAILTAERINCPFGLSDGAWTAWQFAQDLKLVKASDINFLAWRSA